MKNVLVIGSTGQIGSELTMKLRSIYSGNIVAGYIPGAEPKGELLESGPAALVDITNEQQIAETVSKYNIDTIYNLAALLSAVAETKPQLAWKIGMGGLFNVLEVDREIKPLASGREAEATKMLGLFRYSHLTAARCRWFGMNAMLPCPCALRSGVA